LDEKKCEDFVAAPALAPVETGNPTISAAPTVSLVPTTSPTTVAKQLCSSTLMDEECVQVTTFADFKKAIHGVSRIVFCGDFRVRKPDLERLVVASNIKIICKKLCTIYGRGNHLLVTGEFVQAELQKVKFMNSDESAVQIETGSSQSTITFCGCQFWSNSASDGKGGGAIGIEQGSGVVNVVDSHFANNDASFGGAISSEGYLLNVIGSKFVMNQASTTVRMCSNFAGAPLNLLLTNIMAYLFVCAPQGSAIATATQSHLLIRTSMFGLNRLKSTIGSSNYAITVRPGTYHTDLICKVNFGPETCNHNNANRAFCSRKTPFRRLKLVARSLMLA
jgi:hypothetical protein